jgi:hypothetical protein
MNNLKEILPTIILIGILSISLFAESASNCLDKVKLQAIAKDFSFFGNARPDLCDEGNHLTKIIRAIQFIKDINFLPPSKGIFNQNILPEQPYPYFKIRVEKIILDENCVPTSWSAYVNSKDNDDKIMHVCPGFYNLSVLERASALIHEARHLDGYGHVNCIRGPSKHIANNQACDFSYTAKGSYAIGVDFNIKISQDPEINPVLRNKARVSASGDLVARFNLLPGDLKDGAFLTDENHMLSFFDGVFAKNISQLSENQILIANEYMHPVIKGILTSQLIDLTWGLSPLELGSGKKKISNIIIDAAVVDNYVCYLLNSGLVCKSFLDGSSATIQFSQIKLASIYSQIGTEGYPVVMITDHDGRGASLPSDFEKLRNLRESQISFIQNTANILKVQDWQGGSKKIVVTQDGRLFFLDGRTWIPLLPTKSFSNVVAPVVWSSSLQAL